MLDRGPTSPIPSPVLPGGCVARWRVGWRLEEPVMATDVTAVLRQTYLLRSVPAGELEAIAALSRLRVFRRGQVIFTAGDPGGALMVVGSGRVKVVVRSADGGELTLTIIELG